GAPPGWGGRASSGGGRWRSCGTRRRDRAPCRRAMPPRAGPPKGRAQSHRFSARKRGFPAPPGGRSNAVRAWREGARGAWLELCRSVQTFPSTLSHFTKIGDISLHGAPRRRELARRSGVQTMPRDEPGPALVGEVRPDPLEHHDDPVPEPDEEGDVDEP